MRHLEYGIEWREGPGAASGEPDVLIIDLRQHCCICGLPITAYRKLGCTWIDNSGPDGGIFYNCENCYGDEKGNAADGDRWRIPGDYGAEY